MDYYCAVRLKDDNRKLSVKSTWIENIHNPVNIKYGYKKSQAYKIFYSKHHDALPNFNLAVKALFDDSADACYFGYIYNTFGKQIHFNFY